MLVTVRKLEAELSSKPGSFDPSLEDFRKQNGALLQQLQETVVVMKSSWPTTLPHKKPCALPSGSAWP